MTPIHSSGNSRASQKLFLARYSYAVARDQLKAANSAKCCGPAHHKRLLSKAMRQMNRAQAEMRAAIAYAHGWIDAVRRARET